MKYVNVEVEGTKWGKNGQVYDKTMIFEFATSLELNVGDRVILPEIHSKNGYEFSTDGIVVQVDIGKKDFKYKEIKEYFIPKYLQSYGDYVELYGKWLNHFNNGTTKFSWVEYSKPKKDYLMEKYNEFQGILQEQLKAKNEEKLQEEKEKQFEKANKKKGFFQRLLSR
jgi:hypothetical protein